VNPVRARLVYESDLGKALAYAIAEGLGPRATVRVVSAADAARLPEPAVDLLVVGGPTHAFGAAHTYGLARAALGARPVPAAEGEETAGVRDWLAQAAPAPLAARAAAFGTKLATTSRLPGSTAHTIGRRLRTLGYELATTPADFLVTCTPPTLLSGELRRAWHWGAHLAATV